METQSDGIKFTYKDYKRAADNKRHELLGENGYELAGIYSEGQTFRSLTPEGFAFDLDEIF